MENNTTITHVDPEYERCEEQELQNGINHAEHGEAFISAYLSEDSDFLEHYGIKGMKWGIRRFQNKDGSLTKAGLKRYSDAASNAASKVGKAVAEGGKKLGEAAGKAVKATKDKISEKHAQRKEEKRIENLMSKPIRKLTEEERIERMDRKMKERDLLSLEKNVRELNSGSMAKGRKFLEDMVTKVAIPSVLNAGEKQLTAFLNKKLGDALGLGDKSTTVISDLLSGKRTFADLTDQEYNIVSKGSEGAGLFNKNLLGKNPDQNDGGASTTNLRDIISGKKKVTDFDDKTIKENAKTAEAASTTEKYVKSHSTADQSSSDSKPKSESKSASETKSKNNKSNDGDDTVLKGTVSGAGTSKSKKNKNNDNASRNDPIYTEFVDNDAPYSQSRGTQQYQIGRSVVAGLLEEFKN